MKAKEKYFATILIFMCFLTLFSGESLSAVYDLRVETSHQTIYGRDSKDESALQAVGDLNADGIPDLIIGAYLGDGADGNRKNCGEVYIFFGRGIVPCTDIDLAVEDPDIVIYGDDPGDHLGSSAAVGDVSGDGIDDLIVTAPYADGPGNVRGDAGEVYVIYGRKNLPTSIKVSISDLYDARITGALAKDTLGMASWNNAIALGDVNGDGIKDILVFANAGPKRIYMVDGSKYLPREIDLALGGYALLIYDSGDGSPYDEIYSGDFDGDRYDDVIFKYDVRIGAPQYEKLFVFYGRQDLSGEIDLNSTSPDLQIVSKFIEDAPGDVVSFATSIAMGDINGDGDEDLLVSDTLGVGPDGTRTEAGEIYIIYGGKRITGKWDLKTKDPDVIIYGAYGEINNGHFGYQIALGNLNGDSYADIIAMGTGPEERYQAGQVFVIPGAPDLAPQIDLAKGGWDLRVLGADEWDWMGGRIAVSDLNLDGRGELILSSWLASGPDNLRTAAGETVILYCTPCIQPGIDAGPDTTSCEGMSVTLMSAVTCLPGCPETDYRFRWIDCSTGLAACDWNSLPSCSVTLSQDTTFTAEAMCSSNPGTVLQDQMSISVLPDPLPGPVGNTLRAVKEGNSDIRFTWLDLTMPTGGYELVILPSTAGAPTPGNMDGADVVHYEVIPPGDQFQIHIGGQQLPPALNFYKVRAISACTHALGPTGN